jgi:hypothetical protein
VSAMTDWMRKQGSIRRGNSYLLNLRKHVANPLSPTTEMIGSCQLHLKREDVYIALIALYSLHRSDCRLSDNVILTRWCCKLSRAAWTDLELWGSCSRVLRKIDKRWM